MKARGLRNNNPLNIRHGLSRWEGRTKIQTDLLFVTFRTMAFGYRAAWKLMDNYRLRLASEGKPYTLHYIIHRWAPTADGNNTGAYIYNKVSHKDIAEGFRMAFPEAKVLLA